MLVIAVLSCTQNEDICKNLDTEVFVNLDFVMIIEEMNTALSYLLAVWLVVVAQSPEGCMFNSDTCQKRKPHNLSWTTCIFIINTSSLAASNILFKVLSGKFIHLVSH